MFVCLLGDGAGTGALFGSFWKPGNGPGHVLMYIAAGLDAADTGLFLACITRNLCQGPYVRSVLMTRPQEGPRNTLDNQPGPPVPSRPILKNIKTIL